MARRPRIKISGCRGMYHVVMRTNGQEFRLDSHMKKSIIRILKNMKELFRARVVSYTVLDNHYHVLLNLRDADQIDPEEAIRRWNEHHNRPYHLTPGVLEDREYVTEQLSDISAFMKRLNQQITLEYNRYRDKKGTLWQSRYHSTVFSRGVAAAKCAAYIELNSFRASLTARPEDYPYSSLHHLKQGNKDGLVSTELLQEGLSPERALRLRRRYVEGRPLKAEEQEAQGAKSSHSTREIYETLLAYVYRTGTRSHRDSLTKPREERIRITEQMIERLKEQGIYSRKEYEGSFYERVWPYSSGQYVGEPGLASEIYAEHIQGSYADKEEDKQQSHLEKWIHGEVGKTGPAVLREGEEKHEGENTGGLSSVFNEKFKEREAGQAGQQNKSGPGDSGPSRSTESGAGPPDDSG